MTRTSTFILLAVFSISIAACRPKPVAEVPNEEDSQDAQHPADAEGNVADEEGDSGEGESDGEPDSPAPETEDPPKPSAPKPTQVTLGDPSLTAGIPGDGPLEVDEIATWLADESNHQTLEITLPKGIAGAAAQIQGVEENPMTRAKIELGRQLYFDARLSADSNVSCASCHDPDEGFSRETRFGIGINAQEGNRNSPVAYNRILSGAQFWDGRAESLEAQAVGPIANPIEMGNTHEACVECVAGIEGYKRQFDAIFDDGVTIDNIGKAIATFERTLVTGPSAYDYWEPLRVFRNTFEADLEDLELLKEDDPDLYDEYMELVAASEKHPFSESAERGREIFFTEKGNCTACHAGANFSDEKYHNLGVGMEVEMPDLGRYEVTKDEKDKGAFKTPTVRNITSSAPYMHDGSQNTLEEVVEWYAKGGHPNPHLSEKMKKLELTDQDKQDLVAFMKALTGEFPKVERGRLPK